MSSPLPANPLPTTTIEAPEKAAPSVLDDINQKLNDARHKACSRKSIVLDSAFIQRAKSQARRLIERKSSSTELKDDTKVATALAVADSPVDNQDNGVSPHVAFRSPLTEQITEYQGLIANNIEAILAKNNASLQSEIKNELDKWAQLIQEEQKLQA